MERDEPKYNQFNAEIGKALEISDINKIYQLITSDTYSDIPLEHKELQAFTSSYISQNKELIRYFIFDYRINEKEPLDLITTMNDLSTDILNLKELKQEVLKMFEMRKLSEEIKTELGSEHKNNKKPKA
jgi:hypothetical protein